MTKDRRIRVLAIVCAAGMAYACADDPVELDPKKPIAVAAESGNNQVGQVGAELPLDPRVKVVGQTGLPVASARVAFQVGEGSGSVVVDQAVTDGNGIASAGMWTLGNTAGEQRLEAVVEGLTPFVFTATATGVPASLVVVGGDGQSVEVGMQVSSLPEVQVLDASGAGVANIPVVFLTESGLITGTEAMTDAEGKASVGSWTLGTVAGVQRLEAAAAVPGSSIEGNPAFISVIAVPGPPVDLQVFWRDGVEIEAGYLSEETPRVRVEDSYGNGVPGVGFVFDVTAGGGKVEDPEQTTDADGVVQASWVAGPDGGVQQTLTATAATGGAGVEGKSVMFNATSVVPFYDIRLVETLDSEIPDDIRALFDLAESRWENVIRGNLEPTRVRQEALLGLCTANVQHPPVQYVDDVIIYSTVKVLDGPGGLLGQAGPCVLREDGRLPAVGEMEFDLADFDRMKQDGALESVILHEMGHVLGFGSLWKEKGLLRDEASPRSRPKTSTRTWTPRKRLFGSIRPVAKTTPLQRFPLRIPGVRARKTGTGARPC